MLLISDEEVRKVLTLRDCIEALERAFAEEARGIAVNRPGTRYKVPPDLDQPGYMANIIAGAVPSSGMAALRYDSSIVQERVVAGIKRMDFPSPMKRSWGFVLLFSLQTGQPLALIHDFSLSSIRVGATTGVAHRALAKQDAGVIGLFGSGNQARTNLAAICSVRPAEKVKVYSSTKEHRDRFAEEMIRWDRVCELGQVVIGRHPGRTSNRQIIYYKSNTGVGIQFAAAGALIYEACRKKGLGRELPSEWFGADVSEWVDKGFMPSP